ncbi:MAG: ATP-binding protein [Bacilli bacterium]|nr:ATP-binding protein [Bacilli bacterium]
MKKIKQIPKKINIIKVLIVELYLVVAQLIWHLRVYAIDYMVSKTTTELQIKMINAVVNIGLVIILSIILIALIITLKRHNKAKEEEQKNVQDVGLKNESGEFIEIVEILDGEEENEFTYVVNPKNLSIEKLRARQDDIETAYHIDVHYMTPRIPTKYINIYATPRDLLHPKLFQVTLNDNLLDDFLSALVVGSTGSGKTYFTYQLLGKIALNKSCNGEDVRVFISDIKNEDFRQFKNRPNYYGINAVDGIKEVRKILQERMENDEDNEDKETIILLIEEYAVLLNSIKKKSDKEEIKDMVADLLFAGRSKKIITIVSLQRADAEYFVRGAREQFKKIILMGEISDTQMKMLVDEKRRNQFKEINPRGYGYLCEDGKMKVTRIQVAEISQKDKEDIDNIISSKMV